ncbi:MAG: type II toxin-antitoxin system VapC family toxin [Acidimicrobiales bacterium]
MNLLLDTHALYWWMTEDIRFPPQARAAIEEGRDTAIVSAVSVWEIEIKRALGKLRLDVDLGHEMAASGFPPLSITVDHAVAAGRLPAHHSDPFDRMLVAQANLESLVLVSRDRQIRQYDVPTLWD